MKDVLYFLLEVGKLKNIKRKGVTFYGIKSPDSATDHTFRMAMMVWLLAGKKKKIHIRKSLKMALIHDLCKIYTGDITPYNGLLPKEKKRRYKFVRSWRRLPLSQKRKMHIEKLKKEKQALKKLTACLPNAFKKEVLDLWSEYQKGKSPEAKFVSQIDVIENLIEAFEWWKKDKKFPTKPWWEHADEVVDDPILLEFIRTIAEEELEELEKLKRKKRK